MFFTPVAKTSEEIVAALGRHVPAEAVEALRSRQQSGALEPVFGSGEAELVALMAGLKPLARQLLAPGDLDATRARALEAGLTFAVSPVEVVAGRVVAFVSPSADHVRDALAAEQQRADERLGALLGYPACCVAGFLEREPWERANLALARAAAAKTEGAWAPRLNNLDFALFHYLPWSPCRYDCEPSRRYADEVAGALAQVHRGWAGPRGGACTADCRHARFVREVDLVLGAHRLVLTEAVQVSLRGVLAGSVLRVTEAWATFRDRPLRARPSGADEAAALALAAAAQHAGSVEVHGDLLRLGGRRVLRAPEVLLAPFGEVAR